MAKENITREELENIIREEIVREGFLDRVMAKSKGNLSALKALGQRSVQGLNLIATGNVDASKIQDPKIVRSVTIAVQRIKGYQGKFAKLLLDFSNDLELMFGDNLEKAPQIKHLLDKLDNSATSFAKEIGLISDQISSVMSSAQNQNIAQNQKQSPPEVDVAPQQQAQQYKSNPYSFYDEPPNDDIAKKDKELADKKRQAQQYKLKKLSNRRMEEELNVKK